MFRIAILICSLSMLLVGGACSALPERSKGTTTPIPAEKEMPKPTATQASTPQETAGMSANLACQSTDTGDYEVYKKQTFAIDFEPFRNSCFVTSNNPEYDDPPMESQFAIYRNGKKLFDFPSQFNGVTFGCWVDAVSFQDLNEDRRTDVIVVAKCQAKSGEFNENMVYVNDGKAFTTREDANTQVGVFKTVKDIADFVKENPTMFF